MNTTPQAISAAILQRRVVAKIPVLKEPLDITTAQASVHSGNYIPGIESGYQHNMGAFQDLLFLTVTIFILQSDQWQYLDGYVLYGLDIYYVTISIYCRSLRRSRSRSRSRKDRRREKSEAPFFIDKEKLRRIAMCVCHI